jgi:hypothetical protein
MTNDLPDIRPRTVGEILDDAWRLYLAQAPQLLVLSGLYNVPAAVALVLLLTRPAPEDLVERVVLPAVTATLLVLTGLGSGACQEAFRRRAEGLPVRLGPCLAAAARRGLWHISARAAVLTAALVGGACLAVPGLAVLVACGGVHPALAGDVRLFDAFQDAAREAPRALVVALARLALLAWAVLNLHLLAAVGLWVAGNLGGLDTALLDVLFSLGNPVYAVGLLLLAWLLLAPFAEAANFLLFVDGRVRHHGYDLWYRVRRLFPALPRGRAGAAALGFAVLLLAAGTGRAADARLTLLRGVRQELARITDEVKAADPYPGGARWAGRLHELGERLDREAPGRYPWFAEEVKDFAGNKRGEALDLLEDLDDRLAQALKDELKGLLSETTPDAGPEARGKDRSRKKQEAEADPPARPEDPGEELPGARRGRGVVAPMPGGGFNTVGWLLLLGLVLAVLVVAGVLFWRRRGPRPAPVPAEAAAADALEDLLRQPEQQTPAALWRRAEELARQGDALEAVRALYLAVLALLHRAHLIRYERTRTNGEYVRQLRLAPEAPEPLHARFERLTAQFERKWYGERACRADDYEDFRGTAEEIRDAVAG